MPLLVAAVTCPQPPPRAEPRPDRPRYVVDVRISRPFRTITGHLSVTFTPTRTTNRLVFRLWPNGPPQLRAGSRLDIDLRGARHPNPTTVILPLRRTLAAGASVRAGFAWRLKLPVTHWDRIARFADGVRLGTFLPLLAWDDRRGWLTDPPARILAESAATPTADFDLRVHAPPGYQVLATGDPLGGGHFRARAVRDIALAVGRFRILSARDDGVTIRVASLSGNSAPLLADARRALQALSARYGPYPWRSYTVVVPPDLHSEGIEYPMLTFVGRSTHDRLIVDHETAHQWFYSLVGNDQARDPWLDETLATWAQVQLGSGEPPPRRPPPAAVARHVGAPMSYWDRFGGWYFYGVYGGGLKALRSLGDDDAVECALRAYVARRAYAIAHPADLLDELDRVIPGAANRLRAWGIHR